VPSWFIAVLATGVLVLWLFTGTIARAPAPASTAKEAAAESTTRVTAAWSLAVEVPREVRLHGALEPRRRVTLRAETTGVVSRLLREKGERVAAGDVIALLAEEDRPARLAAAEREVTRQEAEVTAARRMGERGLQSETQRLAAEAALASARAERAILQAELARTRITAPFAGVLTDRPVEVGSLLERGDEVATLADEATLLAVAQAPQQVVASIREGQAVTVRLLDGQQVQGVVHYVASVGDASTRSFRIEAEVPNADGLLPSGLSADLIVTVGTAKAHAINPALLSLDDAGRPGVKALDEADRVTFLPVDLLQSTEADIRVTGLPDKVRLVVEGQGLVAEGERVAVAGDQAIEAGDPR
jgi:membrane fusion protein, multidrug efflux system